MVFHCIALAGLELTEIHFFDYSSNFSIASEKKPCLALLLRGLQSLSGWWLHPCGLTCPDLSAGSSCPGNPPALYELVPLLPGVPQRLIWSLWSFCCMPQSTEVTGLSLHNCLLHADKMSPLENSTPDLMWQTTLKTKVKLCNRSWRDDCVGKKDLLCKQEAWVWISGTHVERARRAKWSTSAPMLETEAARFRIVGPCWLASLDKIVSSGFSKGPCFEKI